MRNGSRHIEIVGGGLAGLSLGLALRRAGVPVTVFEAGEYPRHRVCGEFITGLGDETIARLELGPFLSDACLLRRVSWFVRSRYLCDQTLPVPAFGLSRYVLDARLATTFVEAGGDLRTKTRMDCRELPEGRVYTTGRRPRNTGWLGLKVHCRGITLDSDLEVHLGEQCYVGLCRIEEGGINVCGLFRRNPGEKAITPKEASSSGILLSYLRASGLEELAQRLSASEIDQSSFCAVAALDFHVEPPLPGRIRLGDTHAMIPPFTGHGMAMAFQGASIALEPLLAYAKGLRSWEDVSVQVTRSVSGHFRLRLGMANTLHSFLYRPARQRFLAAAGRAGLLPLRLLYQLTH